jgi:DDE superfamily endonuclease
MAGEKLPLLVIGKSLKPRCLKRITNIPVTYTAYSRAWMNGKVFEGWIRHFDSILKRKVLLIIDNRPAHP